MKTINKTYLALTLALLLALPLAVNARVPKRIYLEKTRVYRWNSGKLAELHDRVTHIDTPKK